MIGAIALTWLVMVAAAMASGVTATLDRDQVALGDTVTLTLHSSNGSISSPDLSPLHKDFQMLGQTRGATESWINGKAQSQYTLSITLRPLHAGALRIPALDVGGQRTSPLTLHVSDAPAQGVGHAGDPAFLEVTPSTTNPYVGQQIALDVKLYYAASMLDGNLTPPNVDHAQVQTLGRDQRYQTQRGGRTYGVIERHYAIIPQKAGTLNVTPIVFRGRTVDSSGMGDFFGTARTIGAQSKVIELHVRPRPAGAGNGPWLPARQVELNLSGLPASGKVQVGEPVTVTLQEGATGLPAELLPEPTLPDIPGADVYPDQTQDVSRNNGQWITGSRSRGFAIVPNRAGILKLPPITLRWWNTQTDREETAKIPAHILTVVAAAATSSSTGTASPAPASSAAASTPAPAGTTSKTPSVAVQKVPAARDTTWRWVALASGVLWLLSALAVAAWWWWRRGNAQRKRTVDADERGGRARTLRNAFLVAARSDDLDAAAHALLRWARAERPAIRHLQDLGAQLDDAAQVEAIARLQRSRYAVDGEASVARGSLAQAFRAGFAWRKASGGKTTSVLPPLYPPSR
ncbi:BatD family protein [Oleiagrimonas sp. MCCC 1A03011]|uniref:BatD family protein n=1 Tax=Oleiagrimonas sp. MCCC 1A03011 TaxID=1926883 RepID=UPI000DC292A1|nr:BatD family protein [Oleiagrimonas sp. MCCC 1A03011]RAP59604.1 hypothetical protein BTJ49_02870 [Oleiagrimonas sp. MCCC 1A03011]